MSLSEQFHPITASEELFYRGECTPQSGIHNSYGPTRAPLNEQPDALSVGTELVVSETKDLCAVKIVQIGSFGYSSGIADARRTSDWTTSTRSGRIGLQ